MRKLIFIFLISILNSNLVFGLDSLHYILTKGSITLENSNETYAIQSRANDSQAWFSITGLMGIEGARILIKHDSTYFKDKLHNTTYLIDNRDGVQPLNIPININLVKTLIDNQYRKIDSPVWILQEGIEKVYATFDGNLISRIYMDTTLGVVKKIVISQVDTQGQSILEFQDYEKINNFWIAKKRNFRAKIKDTNWNISIIYSKIQINEPINLPFNVD